MLFGLHLRRGHKLVASPNLATLSVGELIQATLLVYMGQVVE